MKQKLFMAGLALAAGLVFNVSKSFSLKGASISEIVSLNSAQAACNSSTTMIGRCSVGGMCFAAGFNTPNCAF